METATGMGTARAGREPSRSAGETYEKR